MKTKTAGALHIDRLYHYQSFEKPERLARILTDQTLYFSGPSDFNDPWDCQPFFNKSALDDPVEYNRTVRWFVHRDRTCNTFCSEAEHIRREQRLQTDRKFLERKIDQMTSEMKEAIQKQYRVYCLSTHVDSTLMWSHYADSCRGLYLEFCVQNELFCCALQVDYHQSYPLLSVADTDEDANLLSLLAKSGIWSYENEFRLVASEPPFVFPGVPTTKEGLLSFPKGALQSIILGTKMSICDRERVRALVKKSGSGLALKVADLVPDRYEFEISTLK